MLVPVTSAGGVDERFGAVGSLACCGDSPKPGEPVPEQTTQQQTQEVDLHHPQLRLPVPRKAS